MGPEVTQPIQNADSYQPSPSSTQYVAITSDKSKKLTLILCILSLSGISGLHRFYVGKIFTGILHFLTCGVFWIGTLIDLVQILTKTFTDGAGQPIRR